ncbi:hypothetical protein NLM33_33025 [Bradyrhizobium sp. CCGUVB1N3]|nr:hypothetical protein [Bradyrhizobium sp. CCGUVB1N3]
MLKRWRDVIEDRLEVLHHLRRCRHDVGDIAPGAFDLAEFVCQLFCRVVALLPECALLLVHLLQALHLHHGAVPEARGKFVPTIGCFDLRLLLGCSSRDLLFVCVLPNFFGRRSNRVVSLFLRPRLRDFRQKLVHGASGFRVRPRHVHQVPAQRAANVAEIGDGSRHLAEIGFRLIRADADGFELIDDVFHRRGIDADSARRLIEAAHFGSELRYLADLPAHRRAEYRQTTDASNQTAAKFAEGLEGIAEAASDFLEGLVQLLRALGHLGVRLFHLRAAHLLGFLDDLVQASRGVVDQRDDQL